MSSDHLHLSSFPTELLEKILSYISRTDTYKNARLTCRAFRNVLSDMKVFEPGWGQLQLVYQFSPTEIIIYDGKNNKVGFIKQNYPCLTHYSLKRGNETREQLFYPNKIITSKMVIINNVIMSNYEEYNIKTKKYATRSATRYIPHPPNPPHHHPVHNVCHVQ